MNGPLRVACVGALGRMGERVRAAVGEAVDAELVGALESHGHAGLGTELGPGVRVVDDARVAELTATVRQVAPTAFWTVQRLGKAHASVLPEGFLQIAG